MISCWNHFLQSLDILYKFWHSFTTCSDYYTVLLYINFTIPTQIAAEITSLPLLIEPTQLIATTLATYQTVIASGD